MKTLEPLPSDVIGLTTLFVKLRLALTGLTVRADGASDGPELAQELLYAYGRLGDASRALAAAVAGRRVDEN